MATNSTPTRAPQTAATNYARLGASLAAAGVHPDTAANIINSVQAVVADAVSEAIILVIDPILQAQAAQFEGLSTLIGGLSGLAPWARTDRDRLAAHAAQAAGNLNGVRFDGETLGDARQRVADEIAAARRLHG